MHPTLTPFFAENPLDKMDHLRETIDWQEAHPDAEFILFSEGNIVIRSEDEKYTFTQTQLKYIPHDPKIALFLGNAYGKDYFALSTSLDMEEHFEYLDLRTFVFRRLSPVSDLGIVAQAGGVLKWHETHRFCANCGSETNISYSGWRRDCPSCEKQHFPRLDPVIIMLVTEGDNTLIGASHHYPENFYSCLAGFIEPGETIEEAARRELSEEAGIKGGKVDYLCSQPWPFPHSLMIGVHVHAETTDITMDEKELRDAKWVTKSEIENVIADPDAMGYFLPPKLAIARTLLDHWIKS